MNKIKLSTAIQKYDGWVYKRGSQFVAQNSNDLGVYFGQQDILEETAVKVLKVIKYDRNGEIYNILLVYDNYDTVEEWENTFDTLEEALIDICECYE